MLRSKTTCGYFAAGVLEGLGVGVDADDALRGPRQDSGAVALPAGEVDDLAPVRALGDPLVDDEVALVPVVLLRHVGERALTGQVQGRNAGRLVALDEEVGHAEARINTDTQVRKGRQFSLTVSTGSP